MFLYCVERGKYGGNKQGEKSWGRPVDYIGPTNHVVPDIRTSKG